MADPFADFGVKKPKPLQSPFDDFGIAPVKPPAPHTSMPSDTGNPMLDFQEDTNFQPENAAPKMTVDQLKADPVRMGKIRELMSKTKDIKFETAPADEVVDSWMTHMRWMNANEVSTGLEWMKVEAADEETKALYGDTYRIHEELGNFWENGEGWGAVKDYAYATVTAPSTLFGMGVGKLGGVLASRAAAKKLTQTAITQATKTASTPTVAKAISEGADAAAKAVVANQAKVKGGKVASSDVVKRELQNFAAKGAAKAQVASALTFEMGAATFQDVLYQDIMMNTGVQDSYNLLQGTLATLGGGLGAIPGIMVLRKSANSPLANVGPLIENSFHQRAKTAGKRATPKIVASLKKASTDWNAMAEAGKAARTDDDLRKNLLDWFFNPRREDSLFRILLEEGAVFDTKNEKFTDELLQFAYGLADEDLSALNDAFKEVGLKFGEAVLISRGVLKKGTKRLDAGDLITATTKLGGEILNPVSEAARFYNAIGRTAATKKKAGQIVDEAVAEASEKATDNFQPGGYALSTWKKLLVSNPVTTAVNVAGWGQARFGQMLADTVSAGALLGRSGMEAVTNPAEAWKSVGKTRALLANQKFAIKTLVDPFLSAEAFFKFLDNAPLKVQKKVASQIYGGVDNFGPEKFGLNPKNPVVRTTEAIGNVAQMSSFVHLQDTLTKGVSGIIALDKQSRLAFGKGIEQLLADGEIYKLTTDMWDEVAQATLRETFSLDHGTGRGVINKAARLAQGISQDPRLGYFFPFGNFINNTLSFAYSYSFLPMLWHGPRMFGHTLSGKNPVEGIEDLLAKSVVGTTALYLTGLHEGDKQAEGLQWFEERNADGSIDNISNLFPQNILNLVGRIGYNISQGEGMDLGLVDEFRKATTVLDVLETASAPDWVKSLTKAITEPREPADGVEDYLQFLGDVIGAMAIEGGKIFIGGATRPLAPYNATYSLTNPEAGGGVNPDAKQAEGMESFAINSTRNINSFFNYHFGTETGYGVRLMGQPKESATSVGPTKMVNPLGAMQGGAPQPPATALNKVLGMVNKQPFRVDSFTSGNAEYDAFINKNVTPLLEVEAQKLLKDFIFMKAPMSVKMERVGQTIENTRATIVELIEGNYLGPDARILNERRKLLAMPAAQRFRAKQSAGIETDDKNLSLLEIEEIRIHMELDKLKYGLGQ